MIVAKWSEGQRCFSADAQKCAEEIVAIGEDVTPQEVLEKARDENTELHKCFTWDNDEAAERYRIIQARNVIRCLVIREEEPPTDRPEVRFFYKTSQESGYKPTKLIVQKEDEYKQLLKRAYAELRAFKVKYSMLKELEEILALIN